MRNYMEYAFRIADSPKPHQNRSELSGGVNALTPYTKAKVISQAQTQHRYLTVAIKLGAGVKKKKKKKKA